MAQGNTVRLWDTSRSMLLRSWQQIGQEIRGNFVFVNNCVNCCRYHA